MTTQFDIEPNTCWCGCGETMPTRPLFHHGHAIKFAWSLATAEATGSTITFEFDGETLEFENAQEAANWVSEMSDGKSTLADSIGGYVERVSGRMDKDAERLQAAHERREAALAKAQTKAEEALAKAEAAAAKAQEAREQAAERASNVVAEPATPPEDVELVMAKLSKGQIVEGWVKADGKFSYINENTGRTSTVKNYTVVEEFSLKDVEG